MPLYLGCLRCGYSCHVSHGYKHCPNCGKKLKAGTDTREFDPQGNKGKDWETYKKLEEYFKNQ